MAWCRAGFSSRWTDDLPCSWESGYELASADINFVVHLGFPDQTLTIEDLIADEDRVAARLTAVGTHLGEFRGIPATGRRITTETFDFVRVADEKIAERWTIFDRGGLLLELQQRR